jgi:uncharacterized membrane protein
MPARLFHVVASATVLLPLLLLSNCNTDTPTAPQLGGPDAAAGGPQPTVKSTVPSASPRDTSISVLVQGSGFDQGSRAVWALNGDTSTTTTKIHVTTTTFVSSKELVADLTIRADAPLDLYDVQVLTSSGKKGIGIERFEVTVNATALPSLSAQGGGANAINDAGTVVGSSWDHDHLYAVRWRKHGRIWRVEKLPGSGTNAALATGANDIASDGTVVGHRFHLDSDDQRPRALVWPISGGVVELGSGLALGVNPRGTIVGVRPDNDNSGAHGIQAVIWNRTSARTWAPGQLLPRLPGGHSTQALGINSPGNTIVGDAWDSQENGYAVKWVLVGAHWQGPVRLDAVGESFATLVNASGDIAGGGFPCGNREDCQPQAMFWPAGGHRMHLGTLGVFLSVDTPIGLSNSGEVVGLALTEDFRQYAFVWRPRAGTVVELSTFLGDYSSWATDINNHKQAVGFSAGESGGRAVLWSVR